MVNGIRTICSRRLNKGFSLKFRVGSRIQQEILEEGRRMHRSKYCEYNNKDEDNSSNILNDKNDHFMISAIVNTSLYLAS